MGGLWEPYGAIWAAFGGHVGHPGGLLEPSGAIWGAFEGSGTHRTPKLSSWGSKLSPAAPEGDPRGSPERPRLSKSVQNHPPNLPSSCTDPAERQTEKRPAFRLVFLPFWVRKSEAQYQKNAGILFCFLNIFCAKIGGTVPQPGTSFLLRFGTYSGDCFP